MFNYRNFALTFRPEQQAIATVLSDMDAEIAALEQKRDKTRMLEAGDDAGTADREDEVGMSTVGQIERATQDRVVKLFRDQLGYRYLGNWEDRPDNRNIEEADLRAFLKRQGYSEHAHQPSAVRARTRWPAIRPGASTTSTRRSMACCATA